MIQQPPDGTCEADPRPIVRRPRTGLPVPAIAAIAVFAAILLFIILESRRHQATVATATTQSPFASPPPLIVPPEDPLPGERGLVATPAPMIIRTTQLPAVWPSSAPSAMDTAGPSRPPPSVDPAFDHVGGSADQAVVLDFPAGSDQRSGTQTSAGAKNSADAPIDATVMPDQTFVMPAGTIIPATLETPIDTARPGLARAIVSEDTRGFDGKRVLVPRGSRLIGEYQSDVRASQNRVLVTWTRLIRPDGVAIRISSPAADEIGGAGIPGHLNTYFLRRFAGAVMQSALSVGVNLASRPGNGSLIVGLPGTTATVGQDLVGGNDLRPKVTLKQGALLNVFVARDLNFAGISYRSTDGRP